MNNISQQMDRTLANKQLKDMFNLRIRAFALKSCNRKTWRKICDVETTLHNQLYNQLDGEMENLVEEILNL